MFIFFLFLPLFVADTERKLWLVELLEALADVAGLVAVLAGLVAVLAGLVAVLAGFVVEKRGLTGLTALGPAFRYLVNAFLRELSGVAGGLGEWWRRLVLPMADLGEREVVLGAGLGE